MNFKRVLRSKSKISIFTLVFYLFSLVPFQTIANAETKEVNKVKIRFQKEDENYLGWNLWVWSTNEDGKNIEFTHEDENGVFAVVEIPKDEILGFIVKKGSFETKATGNIEYDFSEGEKEIIIKAGKIDTNSPEPESITNEELYKDFDNINLKVNYNREDKDYDKWSLWNWIFEGREGSEDTVAHFTEENYFGKFSNLNFQNITANDKKLGLIVRTESWEKDGSDKIVDLAYLDCNGNLEIFYKEGDDNTYYTEPSLDIEEPEVEGPDIEEEILINQPGGKNKWYVAGSFQGWNNQESDSSFAHLVDGYYKYSKILESGEHEFKIVKNGTWDGFSDDGNNFKFNLQEKTKVDLYINENLNEVRINILGVSGLEYYSPSLSEDNWPRLVGDIQSIFGETNWSPEEAKQMFVDYNFDGSIYKLQRNITPGNYQAKVIFGPSWDENYGSTGKDGDNLILNVLDQENVIFTLDYTGNQKLIHNYKAAEGNYDGLINKDAIYYDSRDITYKKPFGAIKEESEDVIFRIAVEKDDAQVVRVELADGNGIVKTFDMRKATTIDDKDYYEVTIKKENFVGIGIWSYKFIIIDGESKIEYGDDGLSGGTGSTATEGVLQYNLTIYDKDFETPDWMKEAVVYQIFPDRFYDGTLDNNRAKVIDGYRGYVDVDGKIKYYALQYFDGGVENEIDPSMVWGEWSDYPENPRHGTVENKPYYPDSKTDNIWSNEFYGGDIQGIQDKLEYLKDIGITVIYLNPVAWAASNHKYDATDYNHLDPMFGAVIYNVDDDASSGINYKKTREASDRVYQAFAKAAKKVGIRIIADGVFNHVGDDSIYFDRYEKYPEIGAYEYWSKVWDKVNSGKTQEVAEQEVISYYEGQTNSLTGEKYSYPEDFNFINWFVVENEKVLSDGNEHYKYEGWWGYDSLPVIVATEPESSDEFAIDGTHEWNNVTYRETVLGYDLTNMSNEEANESMQTAAAQRWIWMGSSGWRLDVAPDVSTGTWKMFRNSVKSVAGREDANGDIIDDPIILGEEWGVATHYLLGDQFDSVMNYQFRTALQNYLLNGNAETYNNALEVIRENYPKEAWEVMLNLVDSHDTVRNATKMDYPTWEEENTKIAPEASDNALKLQGLTAILQLGYPGAPTIYYGDEVGVTGTKDPDSRRTFPWDRVEEVNGSYSATGKYSELFDIYKTAAKVRNENLDIFASGDIHTAYSSGSVIAYARKSESKGGLLVVNQSTLTQRVVLDVTGFLPNGLEFKDELYGNRTATVVDGKIIIEIPGQTGYMMVSTNEINKVEKVVNLKTEAEQGKITLTWDEVDGAEYYNIYRTYLDGQKSEKIGEALTNAYIDENIVNGTRYYYYVTAIKDSGESDFSDSVTALPSFNISNIIMITNVSDMVIGLGNKTDEILVEVSIPGLTDDVKYVGVDVKGFEGKLVYYKEGTDINNASSIKLRYKEDGKDGTKIYYGSFEPTEEGSYNYFAKGTTNLGDSYKLSDTYSFTASIYINEEKPLTTPLLNDILVESNRATLSWSSDFVNVEGFEVYRKEGNGEYIKIVTLKNDVSSYTDFTVSNNKNYSYKIATFNESYNRVYSDVKEVTPTLVMVEVTLRLHLPSYTPSTDDIYIAGDFNGWNSSGGRLTVPSGATSRDVVEYTFKIMAGKSIQYKYTRGTWNTEAYTSHRRIANDTEDYGNWAYSSTDTNMQLTIQNKGENKMIVDDYVTRWVDMPMIVTMPRISYGEDIEYTTNKDTFTLKSNVPYGVLFTINDENINDIYSNAMDSYGNVYVEDIPLKEGLNEFIIHIEPTQETIDLPWYTDDGRVSQGTKTMKLSITRSEGEIVEPEVPVDPENPVEPEVPVDPENPVEPEVPVDPEKPIEPEFPVDPEKPIEPEIPVTPEKPVEPEVPEDSENPEEPEAPIEPEAPVNPEKPVEPENPVIPEDGVGDIVLNEIKNPNGINEVSVEGKIENIKIEIKDVKSIIEGDGSIKIISNNMEIDLPFSIFDKELLSRKSSIILDIKLNGSSSLVSNFKSVKKVFEFDIIIMDGKEPIYVKNFKLGEVKIILKLSEEDFKGLKKENLSIFYYNEDKNTFTPLETTIEGNNVIFKINSVSKFIIAEKSQSNNNVDLEDNSNGVINDNKILPETGGINTNMFIVLSVASVVIGYFMLKKKELIIKN